MTLRKLHQHEHTPVLRSERVCALSTIRNFLSVPNCSLSLNPHNPLFTRPLLERDLFPENCVQRLAQRHRTGLPAFDDPHRHDLQHDHILAIGLPAGHGGGEEHSLHAASILGTGRYAEVPCSHRDASSIGDQGVTGNDSTCVVAATVSNKHPGGLSLPAIAWPRGKVGRVPLSSFRRPDLSPPGAGMLGLVAWRSSSEFDSSLDLGGPAMCITEPPLFPHGTQVGAPSARIQFHDHTSTPILVNSASPAATSTAASNSAIAATIPAVFQNLAISSVSLRSGGVQCLRHQLNRFRSRLQFLPVPEVESTALLKRGESRKRTHRNRDRIPEPGLKMTTGSYRLSSRSSARSMQAGSFTSRPAGHAQAAMPSSRAIQHSAASCRANSSGGYSTVRTVRRSFGRSCRGPRHPGGSISNACSATQPRSKRSISNRGAA